MNGTRAAANLASTFAVMNREFTIDSLPVSDTICTEPDERYAGFAGHPRIACHRFGTENRESPQ